METVNERRKRRCSVSAAVVIVPVDQPTGTAGIQTVPVLGCFPVSAFPGDRDIRSGTKRNVPPFRAERNEKVRPPVPRPPVPGDRDIRSRTKKYVPPFHSERNAGQAQDQADCSAQHHHKNRTQALFPQRDKAGSEQDHACPADG